MNPSLLSSKKMDYCTPQDFFNKLDQERLPVFPAVWGAGGHGGHPVESGP